MSFTSSEMCELWSRWKVIRIIGEGLIRKLIILLPGGGGDEDCVKVMKLEYDKGNYLRECSK